MYITCAERLQFKDSEGGYTNDSIDTHNLWQKLIEAI